MMLALLFALAQGDASRLHLGRVELAGPLERVRFDLGAAGETVLAGPLAAGETRTLDVPLPAWEGMESIEPRIAVEPAGAGRAKFAGWGPDATRKAAWDALPIGLRSLPRPVPPTPPPLPRPWQLLLSAALFLLTVRMRRRPLAALAVGALGALGLAASVHRIAQRENAPTWLVDGDARAQVYVWIESTRDMTWGAGFGEGLSESLALEVEPARARLEVSVSTGSLAHWRAGAPGATLHRIGVFSASFHRSLTRQLNDWGDLSRVWLREADGAWSFRGSWDLGRPLPDAQPGGDPPSWLNPALPQGVSILIAEEPDPEHSGTSRIGWIRLLGF